MRSLKELEAQQREGRIDLYYADESHICTEGYVPYGWQFPGEDVYIASGRTARLNIFGMIDRQNNYKGFTATDSITGEKVIEFLDVLSFQVRKNTFVVFWIMQRSETSQIICTHSRTNATASKVYTLFSCCIIRNVMWLAANQKPDFRTINAFRGERLKSVIEEVFTATVKLLYEKGYVKLEKYFVDGTKIESAANK